MFLAHTHVRDELAGEKTKVTRFNVCRRTLLALVSGPIISSFHCGRMRVFCDLFCFQRKAERVKEHIAEVDLRLPAQASNKFVGESFYIMYL